MENYDWNIYRDSPFAKRYPSDLLSDLDTVAGSKWIDWVENPNNWHQDLMLSWLGDYYFEGPDPGRLKKPRIFISHRRDDYKEAKQVARIAKNEGFNYWLDIEDPILNAINTNSLTQEQIARNAIASIIEMALLNCSHVVAIQTTKTPGSQWVPYEYGRVKPKTPSSSAAGCRCWISPESSSFPEYLHLGIICEDDSSLKKWLNKERSYWR